MLLVYTLKQEVSINLGLSHFQQLVELNYDILDSIICPHIGKNHSLLVLKLLS